MEAVRDTSQEKKRNRPTKTAVEIEKTMASTTEALKEAAQREREKEELSQEKLEELARRDNAFVTLPISKLKMSANVRRDIKDDSPDMQELVESIKANGLLQPPVVTIVKNEHGVYQVLLISGQRRIRALSILGERTCRCLHRVFQEAERRHLVSLAENKHRRDLSVLDSALAYKELRDRFHYKQTQIAELCVLDRKMINRYLKIARWPEEAHKLMREHASLLTARFLFAIASRKLSDEEIVRSIKAAVKAGEEAEKEPAAAGTVGAKPKDKETGGLRRLFTQSDMKRLVEDVKTYFESKGLEDQERQLIANFLKDMKLVV